ncbi:MAG: efflux RND transporter permease subunit, partial [Gammaproteobacteria bacterium]|nr:efflux RND transporter permease subunit [Gammaproteobacteria bacterium]
ITSDAWIQRVKAALDRQQFVGVKVRMRSRGIRGIRLGHGDDDISVRVQGDDLDLLAEVGDAVARLMKEVKGLGNVQHSLEEMRQELSIRVDRERAADLGLTVEDVGQALQIALSGVVVTDYIEGDRKFDVRLRLPYREIQTVRDLESIILFSKERQQQAIYLGDLAHVQLVPSPLKILRDRQQRIVEISGSISGEHSLREVNQDVWRRLADYTPPPGFTLYDGGSLEFLEQSRHTGQILLGLAIFLVLVVMAVQYESLRNPLVILFSVPFAAIGVTTAIRVLEIPLSMPVWLGMIMLAGIVVNNAIVLVEYIELERRRGSAVKEAIIQAARLRLRPILMTTLTTVVGMLPLALGLGEGSEMLQPLAITIVWGLSFSTVVTLILVPCVYRLAQRG